MSDEKNLNQSQESKSTKIYSKVLTNRWWPRYTVYQRPWYRPWYRKFSHADTIDQVAEFTKGTEVIWPNRRMN